MQCHRYSPVIEAIVELFFHPHRSLFLGTFISLTYRFFKEKTHSRPLRKVLTQPMLLVSFLKNKRKEAL
jgi:hypothetical protein